MTGLGLRLNLGTLLGGSRESFGAGESGGAEVNLVKNCVGLLLADILALSDTSIDEGRSDGSIEGVRALRRGTSS